MHSICHSRGNLEEKCAHPAYSLQLQTHKMVEIIQNYQKKLIFDHLQILTEQQFNEGQDDLLPPCEHTRE